jgi:heavy metal translocating P-type ATPase
LVEQKQKKLKCDLCGLDIDGPPVVEVIGGEEKHFCCQGCARVYRVAYENGMLDQVLPKPKPRPRELKARVADRGDTAYFSVKGMWCAGCAAAAEQILRNEPGVKDVDVSFAAERGRLRYDPANVDPERVLRKLDGLGYQARVLTDVGTQQAEAKQERTLLQLIVAVAFGMQVMLLYLVQLYPLYSTGQFGTTDVRRLQYLVWALATPVLFVGGSSFFRGAWRALRARTANMDTLVAMGTLCAYVYSSYVTLRGDGEAYFDSVVMITVFIMLGRYIETLGGMQARKGIRKLLQLRPSKAWRRAGETWNQVGAAELAVGDEVLIKPGERVPADAEVLENEAAVDESLLTGESAPVSKGPRQDVFAGTLVTDNALIARVKTPLPQSQLTQITQLVDQTLATKPPLQRLADRASAYFAIGVLAVAAATAIVYAVRGFAPSFALLRAVAVLVVACPCALGLATPLALAVTLGRATREGILVRQPAALEMAAQVRRIVFDKTGTLTRGNLTVSATQVGTAAAIDDQELLCLAAAVEQFSGHPIARAIVQACDRPPAQATDFKALRGLGATAEVAERAEHRVMVGSGRFLHVRADGPLAAAAQDRSARGETVIWVGWDEDAAGFIALRDEPNPTARSALQQLQQQGIWPVMLSGDDPRTVEAISAELGLDEYEGDCPPQAKATRVEAWQDKGEHVAMVGDGVNDAPALAQADLSITVASGTDVAGETSDVILMRADLTVIPWLFALSRRTRQIIMENLGWAFAYNLISVPLAALGLISPVIAAAAMASSSLLVVGNSLRLRS